MRKGVIKGINSSEGVSPVTFIINPPPSKRNPVKIRNCPATVRGFPQMCNWGPPTFWSEDESLNMPLLRVTSEWEGEASRFSPQVRRLCLEVKAALARARRAKCLLSSTKRDSPLPIFSSS